MLPIYLHAFLGPLLGPRQQHLLGSGLTWTLDDIHAPPQRLPDPVGTLLLSAVAGIHPQMAEARKSRICPMQQRLDPFVIHHLGAVWTLALSTKPSVSTRRWRLRPLTFLPPS